MPKSEQPNEWAGLLGDIIQYAKYLQWDNEIGKEKAQKIADEIHAGKYGDRQGMWVQAENAIENYTQYCQRQCREAVYGFHEYIMGKDLIRPTTDQAFNYGRLHNAVDDYIKSALRKEEQNNA